MGRFLESAPVNTPGFAKENRYFYIPSKSISLAIQRFGLNVL